MDLKDLRAQIDDIDNKIKRLFEQRMTVCKQVADYKRENKLSVLQGGREDEVLQNAARDINEEFADGSKVLFTNIMDISKCIQQNDVGLQSELAKDLLKAMSLPQPLPKSPKIACPGVAGSYSHIAAEKVFKNGEIAFCGGFEKVVKSVEDDRADFGILPIENSAAGSVRDVYELIKKYDFYINFETKIKVQHCLAANRPCCVSDITRVYSHEQALAQCSDFLSGLTAEQEKFENTATAARFVAESPLPAAAICSPEAAKKYGLTVIKKEIQNIDENYTRFICISKKLYPSKNAGTISVSLSIPNVTGSLYRLLTKFAVNNFNMCKIESKPFGNKNFDAIFYIDFYANLFDKRAFDLIDGLSKEFESFKFLGNYIKID